MSLRSLAARAALFAAVGATAVGCAVLPTGITTPARGTAEVCEPLFREFDRMQLFTGTTPRPDVAVEQPLERLGYRLMRADCLTRARHLDALATAPRTPVVERGAPIRPTSIHAGAVDGLLAEFDVRRHFRERGIRVRSVGAAALGRRIYLGPFRTEGGLRDAAEAAREAGFVAPYATFF